MPARDKTGPLGAGALSGRGFGPCAGASLFPKRAGLGIGFGPGVGNRCGCRRGARDAFADDIKTAENRQEMLKAQRDILKSRLAAIDSQIEN